MSKLIIAALPRSATRFTSRVLSNCKVGAVQHEFMVNPVAGATASVKWGSQHKVEVGYTTIPFLEELAANSDICIAYQWRNPRYQISTLSRVFKFNWNRPEKMETTTMDFIYKHSPACKEVDNHKDFAIQFWLSWVAMMDAVEPNLSFRIEDGYKGLADACKAAGLKPTNLQSTFGKQPKRTVSPSTYKLYNWNELPSVIHDRAIELGYEN